MKQRARGSALHRDSESFRADATLVAKVGLHVLVITARDLFLFSLLFSMLFFINVERRRGLESQEKTPYGYSLDVWSFGAVVYEVLSGETLARRAQSVGAMVGAVVDGAGGWWKSVVAGG